MKVIIIGAGIGGLTTAIALQQRGIDFEIFEASPEIREVGAGIWTPTNAMNVFERLGIAGKIKKEGKLLSEISVGDHRGRIWQTIYANEVIQEFGNGTIAIHRGKLQKLLYDEIDKNKIHTAKKIISLKQNKGSVTAHFIDGTTVIGDVLIGADGIHSVVRKELFGDLPLRYSGQTCWRGITKYQLSNERRDKMIESWGRNGLRFAFSEVAEGQVYFYCTICSEAEYKDIPGTTKNKLKLLFALFGKEAINIIDSAEESAIIRTDLFDLPPLKNWSKGNATLIGDAAHATTPNLGQGGAQAIEDAYVIAKCLAESGNPEAALKKYESIRYKKAVFIVNTSWRYGQLSNINNKFLLSARDIVVSLTPKSIGRNQLKKIYRLNF